MQSTTVLDCMNDDKENGYIADVLSEEDVGDCMVDTKTWKCPKCPSFLSRKQTLKIHLAVKHNIRAGELSKRYKQYETDSNASIPESTIRRWKKQNLQKKLTNDKVNDHHQAEFANGIPKHDTEAVSQSSEENFVAKESLESVADIIFQPNDYFGQDEMEIDSDMDPEETSSDSESAESMSDEDQVEQKDSTPPLYILPSSDTVTIARLTHLQHLLLVSGFSMACNLSADAFRKLLQVIQLHVPEHNICESSAEEVKRKLGFGNDDLEYYVCCSRCGLVFQDNNLCETPGCGTKRNADNDRNTTFVTCNIKKQLRELLERRGIIEKIHAERKKKITDQDIFDITTGQEYIKLKDKDSFLDSECLNHITISWNTDGIPLFKSSSVSLWPVYVTINELPPKERFLRKNIMIWGIWQGVSKPGMNGFLSPFVKEMVQLFNEGFLANGQRWKALLITGTMDLQARAYVLNTTQHNGKFGCLYCLEEGTSVPSGGGHCRSYPFRFDPAPPRTQESIQHAATTASLNGKPEKGILGKSVLSYLPFHSIERNIVVDYMHGVLLGIVKKLLDLWFDGKSFQQPYFIGHQINNVDKLLTKIKPPYLISRLPRKIKNNFHRWKASELRSWFLHYSLPCLLGILPNAFLEHYACFVEGIFLLLQHHITLSDITRAEILLKCFYEHAGDIYGDNFLGLNVHNLQHYVKCVKMWGPLWAYSCFGYESCNGDILKTVHGKGNVCAEIFWAMQAQKSLEKKSRSLPKGELKTFLQKLLSGGAKHMPHTIDGFKCDIVPPLRELPNIDEEVFLQIQNFEKSPVQVRQLKKVYKVVIDDTIFYSRNCPRVRQRNSYTAKIEIMLDGSDVMMVDYFIVEKDRLKVFAVGTSFRTTSSVIPGRVPHVQLIRQIRENAVVPAYWLKEIVVFMDMDKDRKCVSAFPNFIEKD